VKHIPRVPTCFLIFEILIPTFFSSGLVPRSSNYIQVHIKSMFIKKVSIKYNTLAILPTIPPFGLDGSLFGVWKPPVNTKSSTTTKTESSHPL